MDYALLSWPSLMRPLSPDDRGGAQGRPQAGRGGGEVRQQVVGAQGDEAGGRLLLRPNVPQTPAAAGTVVTVAAHTAGRRARKGRRAVIGRPAAKAAPTLWE